MTMLWRAGFLALLLVFVAAWPGSAQEPITGVASVIDGDTIEIHGIRIRFFGIDAPEVGSNAIGRTGAHGAAGSRRRSRCQIISNALPFAARPVIAIATVVPSLFASGVTRI